MTPAIKALEKARISFHVTSYEHDPRSPAYGEEAAQALGLSSDEVFKTLMAQLDGEQLVVAIVPVSRQLDLKALARAAGARKAAMATTEEAERATGYIVGGISPLGQKKRLATFIDTRCESLETIHVSGGRRGLELSLAPGDLVEQTQAIVAPIAR
ncbi:Cys-tRNA(Pro) deacylase [Halomonas huangheensis]|uniref:Cys-tRNA(Pro)/Cys-tRNA(Cys) deacylase n=1 Tax=Halomonas huangheensis TaxID=1178482 RepID=W1NAF5_9GAMM|nr:Cys-tRNA(Pro) deacylase [Halomonas huangheensis]ALM53870.1 aminoacyl-tRNA deacylase [Halomonas huangheensis]ERL52186.1 hypothetical protein BJB45_09475 [Halomonas huangheensis]